MQEKFSISLIYELFNVKNRQTPLGILKKKFFANDTIDSHLFRRTLYTFVENGRKQGIETGEKGRAAGEGGEGARRRKMEKKVESVVRRAQRVIS